MSTVPKRWLVVIAAGAVMAGCGGAARSAVPANRNELTKEDIREYSNAYMAIQSLRPLWLKGRGASSLRRNETVKVYLDGSLLGNAENLRQITVISIGSIRFLDGLEASSRWGLDHGNGAIMVMSRKK